MRQLELKEICGYLPYGLNICIWSGGYYGASDITEVGGIDKSHWLGIDGELLWRHEIDIVKPILRQVSDLYKTITHNGKEIIPIVELAKKTKYDDGWYFNRSCKAISRNGYIFEYDIYRGFKIDKKPSECQYQLFDYLHELKIDYRGLIDSGLAIDANTLKTNPYK
jgi:hypothetical protein